MDLETKKYDYLKFKNSLIVEYLNLQDKYSKIYGNEKTIVLMQVGSFHEAYSTNNRGYNLHKLSGLLNTIVSKKNKKISEVSEKNPNMLGFPVVATPKFLKILINNGFHVIKIDQVTNPPNPKRAITGIYSPGTFIDDINKQDSNNILSIFIEEIKQLNNSYILYIGLSIIDLSVGKSIIHETFATKEDDKYSLDETLKFIYNFNPVEIVINYKNLVSYSKEELINYLELNDKNYLMYKYKKSEYGNVIYQEKYLKEVFKLETYLNSIDELDLEKIVNGRLSYILLLNYCKKHNSGILTNLQRPNFYDQNNYLHLGNNALVQLNVINDNNKNDSLFDIINYTSTSMGRRLLKDNLCNPICDINILNERYNYIKNIIDKNVYDKLRDILKGIIDIERYHRKISLQTLNPCEFINLDESYNQILKIKKITNKTLLKNLFLDKLERSLIKFMDSYKKIFNLDEMIKYNMLDIGGSFYNVGVNKEIDQLEENIKLKYSFIEKIANSLEQFIENKKKDYFNVGTKVNAISINYNERDKYYLQTTLKRGKQIKSKFKKKGKIKLEGLELQFDDLKFKENTSTMKITSKLIDHSSDKIIVYLDKLKPLVRNRYKNDLSDFYEFNSSLFLGLNKIISMIDFLVSGAVCSIKNNYNHPKIKKNSKSFINVKRMRHPIIEKITSSEYIPHDLSLGKDNNGILLYGLNSAGKSSLMKSIGLNLILAQIGYYVAAKEFIYCPYNSIFTRISNLDNLYKGLSSFALELVELKAILKRSGDSTLVLADEVCKGTEYKSALIIVLSMIKMLLDSNTSFISATHLHDLVKVDYFKKLEKLNVFHLNVRYDNDNIIFDRKLLKGNGKEEYGLDFAKYIIRDNKFKEIAASIQDNIETDLFSCKKSKYNRNILMDKCDICESKDKLETHHIEFQKNSDKYGFVLNEEKNHIHKNHESNLVVLCELCHDKIHNNLIIIEGYEETIKGNILNFKIGEIKKKNLKYNDEHIEYILSHKDNNNYTQTKIKFMFEKKYNKNISKTTISKIWRHIYKKN